MAGEDVRLPVGLTTEGLLGRRYMARFIDGIVIVALIAVELAVNAIRGTKYYHFADAINSLSCGIVSNGTRIFFGFIGLFTYRWMLDRAPLHLTLRALQRDRSLHRRLVMRFHHRPPVPCARNTTAAAACRALSGSDVARSATASSGQSA